MYRKLDSLSKQALLVAGLSVAELCIFLIDGIYDCTKYSRYNSEARVEYDYKTDLSEEATDTVFYPPSFATANISSPQLFANPQSLATIIGVAVFSILGILSTIVMIFGIIKKNKYLIVPWIIVALGSTLCFVGYFIYSAIIDSSKIDYSDKFQIFGYLCLTLYPAFMLYLQMHREEGAKQSLETQDDTKTVNVHAHPKYNPYFVDIIEKKEGSEGNLENKQ